MHQPHEIRTRRGYTLIELLIVVALLGLAGTLLIPSMVQPDSMKVQAAVRKIIADLSFAQSDALAQQEFRRVYFFPDGSGYCIVRATQGTYNDVFDSDTADYIVDPLDGDLGRYSVDFTTDNRFENVRVTAANLDTELLADGSCDIVYDPLGGTVMGAGIPGAGGTIELTAGTDVFAILVDPFTGKLTVLRTAG